MSESKVDLDADQNIPIPDKISSSCLSKLEMMVNKLGSLIKKSMCKQASTSFDDCVKGITCKSLSFIFCYE